MFCFGLGYTARALAASLRPEGWAVTGTSRSAGSRRAGPESEGIGTRVFHRNHPLPRPARVLAGVTHMLVSIPPDLEGDPVLDRHAGDIGSIRSLSWVGYLSTVGVYGDRRGGWVDETSECRPATERSGRRAAAEQAWLDLGRRESVPVHVFRLAGIYGPRRNPLEAARRGTARRLFKPGQVFSRIHVSDVVRVLRASMARPDPGAIYNVCDDEPAPPQDVVAFACGLVGREVPPLAPFDEAELTELGRSFYAECRRVRNDRIKNDLGVTLQYPDYRAGLSELARGRSSCAMAASPSTARRSRAMSSGSDNR